jgi:isoamyl acetate esterase
VKQVILIGDSIRMGYQEVVRQALANIAEVWAPEENGGNSRNVLAHLQEWVLARRVDVVHINCGLHDLKVEFGATARAVPVEEYEARVRAILAQLISRQVIWATTTPVNQCWHHANKEFDRFEADVVEYNRAALRVTTELGVPTDDLDGIVMAAGRDDVLRPDGVHYAEAGYRLLGQAVAAAIRARLM